MYHVALDGAGADDRHLDHQVVEAARLEARQHVHLRPAFDLEDADGIGPAEHVVDRRVLARHAGQGEGAVVMRLQQRETLADAGQHAERQHVDFHDAERLDVVLVPLDEGAVRHGGIADRHRLVERTLGQHEAADVLRQVAGKADQLFGEGDDTGEVRV